MGEKPRAVRARVRRAVAGLAAFSLLVGVSIAFSATADADTAPPSGTPATVSADPLPTVQQNGVVYAQVTVGNIVYATGSFTETWPAGQADQPGYNGQPGANETPRANLLAYDITTGALVTSFNHSLNAQGLGIAASPDGKTVYVVGDFTTVDGVAHKHIAAFSTSTGALISSFKASLSNTASAVAATASALYVGGNFFYAGGAARNRLAAFTPSGALLNWAPSATGGAVSAMVLVPDGSRVVVGGRFTTLDGQPAVGMGSLDATTGSIEPWAINTVIQNASSTGKTAGKCGITTLTADGNLVYGGGFAFGCGDFEGTFAADPMTGNVVWINDCHGDTYGTAPIGSVLYVASHAHDCSAIGSFPNNSAPGYNQRATAFTTYATGTNTGPDAYKWNYSGQPDGSLLDWFPTLAPGKVTNQDQAAWSVTGNASYVAYGGEFPTVNGVAQQGLVRFAITSLAPNKVGPIATTSSSTLVPTVSPTGSGQANLSWTATWDRDNANLTYTILRYPGSTSTGATATTVATLTQASTFWQLPSMNYTDSGLSPGSTYVYRIRVTDPLGNSIGSGTSQPVTVSSSGTPPPNATPTAAFTSSCSHLTCTFDGTKSSDPDGTVASWDWDFGDGSTGTGATAEHSYAKSGAHTVTLVVHNSNGTPSAPATARVSLVAPLAVWAKDTFTRSVRSGWGKAETGGTWSRAGCAAQSVSDKRGVLTAARGKACSTWLPGVAREATDTTATVSAPSVPRGGLQVDILGRRLSAANDIGLQLDFKTGGTVVATLERHAGSKGKALSKSVTIKRGPHATGKTYVELQVRDVGPTRVAAKVWQGGSSKPAHWTLAGTTSTSALQHRGSVGIAAYLTTRNNPKTATVRVTSLLSRDVAA